MWLKRTQVKSGGRVYTYLQLVESVWQNGKSRHRVIANLGRENQIPESIQGALLAALSDDHSDDVLDPTIMRLLGEKRYGPALALHRVAEFLGMCRGIGDMALLRGGSSFDAQAALILMLYVCLSTDEDANSLLEWVSRNYCPHSDPLDSHALAKALKVVSSHRLIRELIAQLAGTGSDEDDYFSFLVPCRVSTPDGRTEMVFVHVSTGRGFVPLKALPMRPGRTRRALTTHATEVPMMLDVSEVPCTLSKAFWSSGRPLAVRVGTNFKGRLFGIVSPKEMTLARCEQEGFVAASEIQFRACKIRGVECIVVRSNTDDRGHGNGISREPRDLVVYRGGISPHEVMQAYRKFQTFEDAFYELKIPKELAGMFQSNWHYLVQSLVNLRLMGTYIEARIESRLSACGVPLTTSQAMAELSSLRTVELKCARTNRRYHTPFTEMQTRITEALGIRSHGRLLQAEKVPRERSKDRT